MIDQRPLKVGQSIVHDVKGHGVYTEECDRCQALNTSKVLIYVDFTTGAGPENVSRSCCFLDRLNPPSEMLDMIDREDAHEDMIKEGIINPPKGLIEIILNVCPNCHGQETTRVLPSTPPVEIEHDLCEECKKKLGTF